MRCLYISRCLLVRIGKKLFRTALYRHAVILFPNLGNKIFVLKKNPDLQAGIHKYNYARGGHLPSTQTNKQTRHMQNLKYYFWDIDTPPSSRIADMGALTLNGYTHISYKINKEKVKFFITFKRI